MYSIPARGGPPSVNVFSENLRAFKTGNVRLLSLSTDKTAFFGSEKSCLQVDFLGENASFPYSAFKIASAAGAPIVVFFSYKTGYDSYALKISEIIQVPEDLGRSGESFRPYVTQFVNELELYIRGYPYQFFNFYNMWQ